MHWRTKHRKKEAYWQQLDNLQVMGELPPPPRQAYERVTVKATLFLWSPMDEGNSMARMKWIEDWLVTRGYVVDDKKQHFRWEGIPEQEIDRKLQRIEITLTPVEKDAWPSAVAGKNKRADRGVA